GLHRGPWRADGLVARQRRPGVEPVRPRENLGKPRPLARLYDVPIFTTRRPRGTLGSRARSILQAYALPRPAGNADRRGGAPVHGLPERSRLTRGAGVLRAMAGRRES